MASITSDPNGRKRLQFVAGDGSRKAIRLGKASPKQAMAFKVRVEQLVSSLITGVVDDEVSRWLVSLDDVMYDKLAGVGLVKPRGTIKLGPFLDSYIAGRGDVKAGTLTVLGHTHRNLIEHFGEGRILRTITRGDADEFRIYLVGLQLSDNTIRRRCGIAKQFFQAAARKNIVTSNPFADQKAAVQANKEREFFVTRAMADKVLEECPDDEYRLIVALTRFGGLRCPSETLALRWVDVDWHRKRIRVISPKTEHHPNGGSRTIPMFPELEPYLRNVYDALPEGAGEFVISTYRDVKKNFRTRFERVIIRAGLTPWPKLFHNMRSTRETELAETWPIHVVCAWLGNSQAVAKKHYLQVTDAHFEAAAEGSRGVVGEGGGGGDAEGGGGEAAHIQAQQPDALQRTEAHAEEKTALCAAMRDSALPCGGGMGDEGLEQGRGSGGNEEVLPEGGAESGARSDSRGGDGVLRGDMGSWEEGGGEEGWEELAEIWRRLDEGQRRTLLVMARGFGGGG